jgi:hypothetical protein
MTMLLLIGAALLLLAGSALILLACWRTDRREDLGRVSPGWCREDVRRLLRELQR